MAPHSRLTVYYVRDDGEIVASSTNLVIDRCFQNKVRLRWNELQLRPQEQAELHIRAAPHSACGVAVTDRQLEFNSSNTSTDLNAVWELLNRFTLQKTARDQRLYCINKIPKEDELPPTYELRKKRSLLMSPQDFSDHVDAITAFDDLGVSVITNLVLETRPCLRSVYPDEMYRRSWLIPENSIVYQPSSIANLVLVTQQEPVSQLTDDSLQSMVRDYFPDTWIWSLVYTGREGEVVINSSTPDSITSWDSRVTCVSEREGLGVSHITSVSVFLPFFVHVEAPYSIKMNEKVTIKVIVYNYMHHLLPIVLRFPNSENYIISAAEDNRICLKPMSPYSLVVSITAKTVGMVNLTVQAEIEPVASCESPEISSRSDTVVHQLTVRHEGYGQQESQSAFICPSDDSNPSVTWNLQLPQENNLVRGSASLQFNVVADLFGPALKNLNNLVLLPMGCGEQNLARLAPNIYVLKYMNALGGENQQLKATALKNIKKGYQRQLTFQRSDGSFSAFGERDETGSIWLTAVVVKTLSEARDFIDIDNDLLQTSISWITRQQLENGCFPAIGQVFHRNNEEEETDESTTTLSALVLSSLAGSGIVLPTPLKSNAEFCLKTAISSTDPQTLSLATLALARLGYRQQAEGALQSLMRLAIIQNDFIHWGTPGASLSENIVTTSYAVLSLVELAGTQNLLTARQAIRWISTHRNENGGFVTTQDTIVALEALNSFMTALPPVNRTELMVIVQGDHFTNTFRLTDNNKLVQQKLKTKDIPTTLTASVVGEGCALIQTILKYHVHRPAEGSQLELQVSSFAVSTVDACSVLQLKVCASAPRSTTDMALLTVMMVTGYSLDMAYLRQFSHPHVKKWEEEDDLVTFYLTDVHSLPICLTLLVIRKFEVEDPLPAPITLIDYYHPEISTSKSYSFECSPATPLDEPLMQSDSAGSQIDRFDNFHDVDFELGTPDGDEGPKPVYVCPPNSTLTGCKP